MLIKNHKDLANHIAGKRILHLNSLGKDSLVCLDWLTNYTRPEKIISVYFSCLAEHPGDSPYSQYLIRKYPQVTFIRQPNGNDLTNVANGLYQDPLQILTDINFWEYIEFDMSAQANDLMKEYACDFKCIGNSKYESVARAIGFYKKGLVQDKTIYPLGLMTKQDILNIIKTRNLRVHPIYKLAHSTMDNPSYYKMRSAMLADPAYARRVYAAYPLLRLDKYRYERLFK